MAEGGRSFGRELPLTANEQSLELQPESPISDSSGICLLFENDELLSAEIMAEEKRLEKAAAAIRMEERKVQMEAKKLQKKVDLQRLKEEEDVERQVANERMEVELKARRVKRLQTIVKQSEFYSNFMQRKLAVPLAKQRTQAQSTKKIRTKKKALKKTKLEGKKHVKLLKHNDKYDMKNIIDELNLDDSNESDDDENDEDDEDTQESQDEEEGTYVNTMGFTVSQRQPKLFEGGAMRDYQLDGLTWLKIMDGNSVNGILGDEMGLGKTIQVIALLCHLVEHNLPGPYIVVGPLSTLPNWESEFQRFAPQLPVMVFHGNELRRAALRKEFRKMHRVTPSMSMHPVVLTSYQVPLVEKAFLRGIKWRYLIVDEGHRLKNHNSQLAVELQEYNTANRLLLTGTPVQNNLVELWALLHFLLPDIFADLSVFESWFEEVDLHKNQFDILAQEEQSRVVTTLQKVLSPFLLRRTKADINLNLPPKKEVLVCCPMSALQLQLYKAVIERSIHLIENKEKLDEKFLEWVNSNGPRPKRKCVKRRELIGYAEVDDEAEFEATENLQVLEMEAVGDPSYKFRIRMQMPYMMLRHVVNHPYLIQMPILPGTRWIRVDEELVQHSGKMMVMDAMLAKLKLQGHKVLVFSQFTMVMNLMESMMEMRQHRFCRLDGNVLLADRQERIRLFNTDPDVFVFLISTTAGGLGINLVAADTVIIYDSSYNPQVDLQAQDRCHRIGQTRPVVIYRFAVEGTVDQAIIEWANDKRRLEKIVIQKGAYRLKNKTSGLTVVDLKELEALLLSKDHEQVVHSNGYVFTDDELDKLLDRSSMMDWDTEKKEV